MSLIFLYTYFSHGNFSSDIRSPKNINNEGMFLTNIGEKPKFPRRGLSSITPRGFSSVPPIKQNEYSFYIKPFLMLIFAGTLPLGCIFFFIDYFKF